MSRKYQMLEEGQGLPLVLLHGLMGEPANWRGVLKHLPPGCRAVVPTLPFFEGEDDLSTIPAIREYVSRFLDDMGFDRCVLGGNSLGGHVSLLMAMAEPGRVAGLVLTGSSGLFERELGSHRGANPSREWYYNKMCEVFHDPAWVTDDLVNLVMNTLETRTNRRVLVSIAKSAKRDNLADRLGEVRCPALLIWGRQDDITPPEVAEEFRDLIPNSELVWLDDCGHAAMLEQSKAFAEALGDWWARHIAPQQPDEQTTASPNS